METILYLEIPVGLLLVFLLPGYALAKALFPDWRLRGDAAALRVVELLTLSLVLSVAITILVGFVLANGPGPGFSASWNEPVLEVVLAAITLIGLAAGAARGAYARTPPAPPPLEASPGSDDGWGLVVRLESIDRERRRAEHQLRRASESQAEHWRTTIAELDREAAALRARREAEYRG